MLPAAVHTHSRSHVLLWHFFLQCNWILPLAILGNISHVCQEKLKELQECRRILKEEKGAVAAPAWG